MCVYIILRAVYIRVYCIIYNTIIYTFVSTARYGTSINVLRGLSLDDLNQMAYSGAA